MTDGETFARVAVRLLAPGIVVESMPRNSAWMLDGSGLNSLVSTVDVAIDLTVS